MKVTIRGNNPITSEQFKQVIDSLNEEMAPLGIKVKNMTCYIRFVDENGDIVEPLLHGHEISRTVSFTRSRDLDVPDAEQPRKRRGRKKKSNEEDAETVVPTLPAPAPHEPAKFTLV